MRTNRVFPMAPFNLLRAEFDRLLDPVIGLVEATPPGRRMAMPAVNLWEDGETLVAEAELPGLKHEDLTILAQGDELTIQGKWAADTADKTLHRRERARGEFTRTLTLPFEVDADKVEASLKDGVLTVRLPKAAAARSRKIEVKAN